jgi:hypothetical protein
MAKKNNKTPYGQNKERSPFRLEIQAYRQGADDYITQFERLWILEKTVEEQKRKLDELSKDFNELSNNIKTLKVIVVFLTCMSTFLYVVTKNIEKINVILDWESVLFYILALFGIVFIIVNIRGKKR